MKKEQNLKMNNIKKLNLNKTKEFAKNIRINTLNMITSSKSSHIGSCFSIADVLSVLFVDVMKYINSLYVLSKFGIL